MAHFAKINGDNVVEQVIVAEQDVIDSGLFGDPSSWVQTSYNTRGGVYYTPNSNPPTPDPDQSKAFRKNYAGVGMIWDPAMDAFYDPQPFPSWSINQDTGIWEPPIPAPPCDYENGIGYLWDEASQSWTQVTIGG